MAEKVTGRVASVRALGAAVDGLAGRVSQQRLWQLRMVVGMWDRAIVEWPEGRARPVRSVRAMFERRALRVFWDLAVAGRLRTTPQRAGLPLPVASQRVVRDCLGILAEQVVPDMVVVLPVVVQAAPKDTVPLEQLPVLYRKLADMASDAPVERAGVALTREDRVRLLALVAVVLDTGVRSGELEQMRLEDLSAGERVLVVRRSPQNAAPGEGLPEEWVLRDGTQVALRRWLGVRGELVAGLEGTQSALWVSVRANQWQPKPGFALRAQGIRKAYARGVVALNSLMAGREGWEALPLTLEQVRRAVDAERAARRG